MTDIDRGQPLSFADGVRKREERINALYAKITRNPSLELVRRVDALGGCTFDVVYKDVKPGVQVAQIPGDRIMFVFLNEPEKPPPQAS